MQLGPILQNPFDFSNPVTDRSVLAGRAEEMQQALYYLDQSRQGASYSLALVGDRASGKTSLLNALAGYASETGLIAANIRLDEGFACDDMEFFREMFHSLMEAAAAAGVFAGEAGPEYDTFCRQILTQDLDTRKADEPLAFGRVYATARAQGRGIPLSRRMLLSDLGVIVDRCREAGFPAVVLLIDEGDVLAGNHALLQTIRNLLMDSKHFSLVAAGTEQMFPAISEVFSPVPRQFVRINVGPFTEWGDTHKAIQRRLVLAGQEWAMPNVEVCREIHSLTRGSPYEVMLVSHFAYRELTRIRQRVPMEITPKVIEAVADQLEEQNPAVQETMQRLRDLDMKEAETVRELIELDGLQVDQFALAALDFSRPYDIENFNAAHSDIVETLSHLGRSGFVSVVGGRLKVDADSFQRALIKYVVLGRREEDGRENPLLKDPRRQVANHAAGALKAALDRELRGSEVEDLIFELHRANSMVSFRLAVEDNCDPRDYSSQATVTLVSDGRWTIIFAFKDVPEPDPFRKRIAAILAGEADRLREFDLEVDEIRVAPLDLDALAQFRESMSSSSDPLEDLIFEAKAAFSEGRPDLRERVSNAAAALLETDPASDSERWTELNDCAFMALGIEDQKSYEELIIRVERLNTFPVLSRATRGLVVACRENYDEALEYLAVDGEELASLPDELKENLLMYSPAVLAREVPVVGYNDLIGGVGIEDVLHGYRLAVIARVEGHSVARALGEWEGAPRWLIGAAADAAEAQGEPDFATRLRRKAADMVDTGETPEGA